ncbi:recombinase family protein [Bradyrhizobium arachidis]|uniref:Recombinase domain-containing protein n=1 Tax=Bradyrhizobium arachidis TaxID=858423 RepID=A0AAE7TK53_9BRAD|nr:recombinase family protein [Bradyrhizobium arachidis]QOZ71738.1 hypothetical protein WN72_39690 [Bradyrhizobium arachidis]SFV19130.1 Recombinase [Bradyrhizobium arachidis]
MPEKKKISAAPSWLGLSEDRQSFLFIPERAHVVRRIFELAIGGMGSYAIANYLDERKVPTFTQTTKWDHTTIDYMLRNRATYGEYQPKSFASGHKKGIPNGPPVSGYYPAVIDQETFERAQVARQQNLANRGRKGNDLANIFAGLTTCGYCGNEIVLHRVSNVQVLACTQVVDGNGCTRTAWTYRDFEATVFAFLIHPALSQRFRGEQRSTLLELAERVAKCLTAQKPYFATRVEIAILLKQTVTHLALYSAAVIESPRLPSAQISKDVRGRFLEIRLWDGPVDKYLSVL